MRGPASPDRVAGTAVVTLALLALVIGAPARARAQAPADSAARFAAREAQLRGGADRSGRCGTCHPRERVQFEHSRHAAEDVTCVSCHGGNDQALDRAAAHARGFRRIGRREVPAVCASCHSDETKMRPYDLPVDQLALYNTSGHGRRLAQGDTKVAVCSDCHGAHDILAAEDPTSRVFPSNIPKTCGACHGDTTRVAGHGAPYNEYMGSVHAHELIDRGNRHAPSCVSCHGAHGAAPPQVGDVDKVCGNCHTAERRYFIAGPHRAGMVGAGLGECSSCHGAHAIATAQPQRLGPMCARCHGDGSPHVQRGARMFQAYDRAAKEIDHTARRIEKDECIPIPTEDYRARLETAHTYLREALPAAHAVDETVVADFAGRARSVGEEIEREIHEKLVERNWRYVGLALFWFYLILTIVILRRFQGRSRRER